MTRTAPSCSAASSPSTGTPRSGSPWPRGPVSVGTTSPNCTTRTAPGPAGAARCTCGGPGHRPAPARSTGTDGLIAGLLVPAGGHHDLILEISDQALPDRPPDPDAAWDATDTAWAAAVPDLANCLEPRDARRSCAVLRGLTSASGGMVAAATTSLPERAEAGRNYDYRYVWIRDQCYAGQAAAAAGAPALLDDAVRFVTARILDHGPDLKPAYTTRGAAVPDQRTLDLPGYPGGKNLIGNWVNQQFQLDVFGESLLLLAAAGRADRLDTDHWKAAIAAADAITARWTEPDAGIWEIDNQPWTHSRLICAAGLRAIARLPHAGPAAAGWLALADRITADTAANAVHPSGRWQRSPQDPGAGRRAAAAAAARRHGPRRPPHHRHPRRVPDRPHPRRVRLPVPARQPATGRRRRILHPLRVPRRPRPAATAPARGSGPLVRTDPGLRGTAELYSEEFDVGQHQLRGNLPQAFVHALHLETAARLADPGPP